MKRAVIESMEIAAETFGLSLAETLGKSRARPLPDARKVGWLLAHEDGWTVRSIALRCGMHHTSVLYGLGYLRDRMRVNEHPL